MRLWKTLCYNGVEYPKYQISSDGDIRNAKGLVLKKHNDKDGYLNIHIKLEKGGRQNSTIRHRASGTMYIQTANRYIATSKPYRRRQTQ